MPIFLRPKFVYTILLIKDFSLPTIFLALFVDQFLFNSKLFFPNIFKPNFFLLLFWGPNFCRCHFSLKGFWTKFFLKQNFWTKYHYAKLDFLIQSLVSHSSRLGVKAWVNPCSARACFCLVLKILKVCEVKQNVYVYYIRPCTSVLSVNSRAQYW